MSRLPPVGSNYPHWKSMPPGSDAYEQVLEDLFQTSSSSSASSSSSSSSSCSSCACGDSCPDRYRVSAAAELRDDRGRSLGNDLDRRLNLAQGQDLLKAPGQGRFDGITRSRSWSPRLGVSQAPKSPVGRRASGARDDLYSASASASLDKRGKNRSSQGRDDCDGDSQRRLQICDFVEDLNRQGSSFRASSMGNSNSTLQEKRVGSGDSRHVGDSLASKKHKTLPQASGKDKPKHADSSTGANHASGHVTGNNGHLSPSYGHAPSKLAAPGHIVTSKEGSPSLTEHKIPKPTPGRHDSTEDQSSSHGADHSHTSLSRLYPRPTTPRGRLSPLPHREGSYDNVSDHIEDDSDEGTYSKDDKRNPGPSRGEEGRSRSRQSNDHRTSGRSLSPRNGSPNVRGSPKLHTDSSSGRHKSDRSPSSSPVPIPQLHNLHEVGPRSAHAHKTKQHVRLCTFTQDSIPSISIDEPEDDLPPGGDQYRPRSMSDASVLHVRRRRQLPRTPIHDHKRSQDDEHVHVHWADEGGGSPLATSVLLTSIRPRALSHGSADMPKKPILKKPFGF